MNLKCQRGPPCQMECHKQKDKSNSRCDGAEKSLWQRLARVCNCEIVRCDRGERKKKKNQNTHLELFSLNKCNIQQERSDGIC